jgi:single-strand DNA-binding protein
MINQVTIVGRLTKTPELRYTPGGNAVTNFTVACNKPKKDGQDQGANFVECVTWGKNAENLCNYQKKGNLIGATGHIQSRSYEANDGKRVYVQEVLAERVQFLEFNGNSEGNSNTSEGAGSRYNRQAETNSNFTRVNDDPFANNGETIDISSDDLPF